MKKTFVFALCTGVCLPFFSGCVDKAYDISNENLDKSAEISGDGIDAPLIRKLEVILQEQIDKLYPAEGKTENGYDLEWDDGVACFTYGGSFPAVELPTFELSEIEVEPVEISISGFAPGMSIPMEPLDHQSLGKKSAKVDATPNLDGGDIKIETIHKIAFESMKATININLEGLNFSEPSNALIEIKVSFPESFKLTPMEGLNGAELTITRPVSELADFTAEIEIEEIDYSGEESFEFTYNAALTLNTSQTVTASNPKLLFNVNATDAVIDYIDAKISGTQTISDKFGDFGDIKEKFAGNKLAFSNPSLDLEFTTNLGVNFDVDLKLNGEGLNKPMNFEKPTTPGQEKTTSYVLSPKQEDTPTTRKFAMDKLFSTFPDEMAYEVSLTIDDENARIQQNSNVATKYIFKLPFEFSDIKFDFEETLENAFDEKMYDKILKNLTGTYLMLTGDIKVPEGMKLDLTVVILDEDKSPLEDLLRNKNVLNDNKLSIEIDISKQEQLEKARHIAFKFALLSKEGSVAKITNQDVISIENVRFESNGGYEIDI